MSNMDRLEEIVARLPEAARVDIEAWDGEPTFRVRGKNFVFTDPEATGISVKLPKEEAAAVVATDPRRRAHRLRPGPPRLGVDRAGRRASRGNAGARSRSGSAPPTRWSRPSGWPASYSIRTARPCEDDRVDDLRRRWWRPVVVLVVLFGLGGLVAWQVNDALGLTRAARRRARRAADRRAAAGRGRAARGHGHRGPGRPAAAARGGRGRRRARGPGCRPARDARRGHRAGALRVRLDPAFARRAAGVPDRPGRRRAVVVAATGGGAAAGLYAVADRIRSGPRFAADGRSWRPGSGCGSPTSAPSACRATRPTFAAWRRLLAELRRRRRRDPARRALRRHAAAGPDRDAVPAARRALARAGLQRRRHPRLPRVRHVRRPATCTPTATRTSRAPRRWSRRSARCGATPHDLGMKVYFRPTCSRCRRRCARTWSARSAACDTEDARLWRVYQAGPRRAVRPHAVRWTG